MVKKMQIYKLNDFIGYLERECDRALYVLGGQGECVVNGIVYRNDSMTKSLGTLKTWLTSIGQSSNFTTINRLYQNRREKYGADRLFHIFDCSGLGMYFLYNLTHIASGDMTANGMMGKCQKLDKSQLKRGDWVFRVYKSGKKKGRAHHVGYVVDNDLHVVEDYGKAKGVIKRAFDSKYWNAYGRPKYFKDEIEREEEKVKPIFNRVLKRTSPTMTGEDVKALQILLNDVNGSGLAVDGRFGPATQKAVREFQKAKGLTIDGKAGKQTITALGGIWQK